MVTNKAADNSGKKKNQQTEDRRIRRTKKLLKKALMELILEKGFEDVRVQDVIDRADVGRTSFYTYFKSKEDLLLQNLDDLEDMFEAGDDEPGENLLENFSLMMFIHLNENWRLAKALMGNKRVPAVRNYVQNIIYKYYKKQLAKQYDNQLAPLEIEGAAISFSSSLVSMTLWWLSMNKPVSPAKIQKLFLQYNNLSINK